MKVRAAVLPETGGRLEIAELDAIGGQCRATGAGTLARSRLIQIPIARLHVEALIPELRRTR